MVIKGVQLDDRLGTAVKTRFYQSLLVGSTLVTAGIGVKSQTSFDDFETLAYPPLQEAKVASYTEVVRRSRPLIKARFEEVVPGEARKVAQLWVAESQAGRLEPLTPIAFEDDFDIAVKSDVLKTAMAVTDYLNKLGRRELEYGNYSQSAQDSVLAFETASVIKYSDFETVGVMGLHQRNSLRVLEKVWPKLSEAEREDILQRVEKVVEQTLPLSRMARRSRSHFVDYLERQGKGAAVNVRTSKMVFPDAVREFTPQEMEKSLKISETPTSNDDFATLLSEMSFAYRNEYVVSTEAREFLAKHSS